MEPNRAMQYMEQGYVCSESVLLAVCQDLGIESEVIPQVAYLFAGGFGNTGAPCGAVCGAMMALSLGTKPVDTMEGNLRRLALGQEFRRRFEAEMGSINCRDLTGLDLTTEEGIEQLMSSDVPMKVCFPAVGLAYQLVLDMLQDSAA